MSVLVTPSNGKGKMNRFVKGESGNPKGRKPLGASIVDCINMFSHRGYNEFKLQRIARNRFINGNLRIAAKRMLRMMEDPDMADYEPLLTGESDMRALRKAGVDTRLVKKTKQRERAIPQGEGQEPIIETTREIELHDRSGQEFDRVIDRTDGSVAGKGGAGGVTVNVQVPTLIYSPSTQAQVEAKYAAALPMMEVDAQVIEPYRIHLGDSYTAISQLPDQFILVESARGRGKTRAHLSLFVELGLRHPGSRWLVVRSTRSRLTDSAIATFVEQVLPAFGLPVPTCERKSISTYRLPNGSEFVFQGLDDPERQQSVECAGVLVVEGCEIGDLETITALAGAMRQVCTPPIEHYRCIVEVNPDAPAHPLNQIAESLDDSYRMVETREQYERVLRHNRTPCTMPGRWKRVVTHWMDNPGYFDVETWTFTAAGESYKKTLEWLTGNLRKRWLYGLWTASQGSVFGDVFDTDVHVVDDFDAPLEWIEHDGWDPGIDHVTGMPFVLVAPTGDLFVRDEVYEGGKSIAEHVATNVRPRLQGRNVQWWGDPHHFFSSTAQSRESCADQACKAGLSRARPWADLRGPGKVGAVNAFLQLLQNTVVYDKTGRRVGRCIYFMRKCVHCIGECQAWKYKRNAKGEQLDGDDKYEDKDNHLIGDPLVGMIATGDLLWHEPGQPGEMVVNGGKQ